MRGLTALLMATMRDLAHLRYCQSGREIIPIWRIQASGLLPLALAFLASSAEQRRCATGLPGQQQMRKEGLLGRLAAFRSLPIDTYIHRKGNDLHEASR